MFDFKQLVVKYMKEVADNIDAGTSEITESQAIDVLRVIAHEVMSKEEACAFLNLSRSRFDDLVREHKIPQGIKRVGFKEKFFYKDELEIAAKRLRDEKNKR